MAARRPGHDLLPGHHRAQGHPRGDPLGQRDDVGLDALQLGGEHAAGAAHAGLHLVEHQHDPVRVADGAQSLQEPGRRDDVAAFAQHRLDDDGRHVLGGDDVREQVALDAAGVAVGGVVHARQQRPEALAVLGLAGGQRQRAQRPPVKATAKGDQLSALGVVAGQLDRRLDRLRARVGEERLPAVGLRPQAPGQLGQLLAQRAVARIMKVGAADVDQHLGLGGDGGADRRMAVPRRRRGDAGLAIEVHVAVDVLHHAAAGPPDHQRIAVNQRRRQERFFARDHLDGARAGRLGGDGDRLRRQRLQRQPRGRRRDAARAHSHTVRLCSRR